MSRRHGVVALAIAAIACGPAPARADLAVIGCVGQRPEAPSGCAAGSGLLAPRALALSPGAGVVYAAGEGSSAVASLRRSGDGRLAFATCLSNDGSDGSFGHDGACADGDGLGAPVALAATPNGRYLYAAGPASGTVAGLASDPSTGALAPAACVADRGQGRCADAVALGAPRGVALSPDGRNLYVAADQTDGVIAFAVDSFSGALRQIGCITDNGTDGVCADGEALRGPDAVVVSPDGAHIYVAARTSSAIAVFSRDGSTGALRQVGCALEDAPPGPCSRAVGLLSIDDLAVSGDGDRLFATADSGAVTAFALDAATGALRQLACVASAPEGERGCSRLDGLAGAAAVAVAPAGSLVVAAEVDSAVLELAVDPATGALSRRSCLAGFASAGCAQADVIASPVDVVVAPDGRVYVAAAGDATAIVALAPAPLVAAPSARVRRAVAAVAVRCPGAAPRACGGRLVLERRRGGRLRVIGSKGFDVGRGEVRRVRVRLRGAAARTGRRLRVSASLRDGRTRGRRSPLVLDARKHR